MTATTLEAPIIFSAESIREAIGSIIQSIQQRTTIKETNLVLDANLSRSLTIAHYVFKEVGLDYKHTACSVAFMTAKALETLARIEMADQFRDEVINQYEVLRHHFRSIPNHGYTLAVANQTYENNVYGLAKWLADQGFSLTKTAFEAFSLLSSNDLKDLLKTPINVDTIKVTHGNLHLALLVLVDILSCYSYIELKKILKA